MIKSGNKPINIKNITLLLIYIWLGLAFYLLLSQISNWLTSHHFELNILANIEFITVRIWLPWVALTPATLWLALRFPIKPKNWLKGLLLHSLFLLSLSLISGLFISLHYHFFEHMAEGMEMYQPWQHIGHFLFGDNLFLFNIIIYTILVTNINIKNFAYIADKETLIASQLNNQLVESQLQTLKMQINPHFLFNTLNVISVLVMKSEKDQATEMINRLSRFFRNSLDEKDQQLIPLQNELNHVEQYLAIEQVRFGDRISIVKNYDENALPILVPSMLLQPLIENAIQHGLEEKEGKGTLTISCTIQDAYLSIVIMDNGAGCNFDAPNFKEGIGISNVKSRLKQLYVENHTLDLSSNNLGGVTVTITLPIKVGGFNNDD